MTDKTELLQITLTSEQSQALTSMAQEKGQSVVELVEKIVQAAIEVRQEEQPKHLTQQLEALECIRQHRAQILAARNGQPINVDLVATLQEIRSERDQELLASNENYPIWSPFNSFEGAETLFKALEQDKVEKLD